MPFVDIIPMHKIILSEVLMRKKSNLDITSSPIRASIISYTLPIIFASLIQVLFNAADLAVLGWFDNSADSSAIGAVGATGAIISLLVNSAIGLSGGTNILLARSIGAEDIPRSRRIVNTSLVLALVGGILMGAVGMISSRWFLTATECPDNCFAGAMTYLYLYYAATPAVLIYSFGAAIIRVSGDSQRPLYYMIISGALKVVMNFILCLVLENKVAAVGIATLASQMLGAVLVTLHLLHIDGPCGLRIKELGFSFDEFKRIMATGLPGAFNGALYSISNLQIQGAINAFGSSAVAGNSASAQIEGLASSCTNAFGTATLTFVGQNIGANKPERVKQSIRTSVIMSVSITVAISVIALLLRVPLLKLFLPADDLAVRFAQVRMFSLFTLFWMAAINNAISSAIQAFGYPTFPMLNSIITVLLFRVVWMSLIYPSLPVVDDPVPNIFNLYSCYMVSWTLSLIAATVMFFVLYTRYKKGKIRSL